MAIDSQSFRNALGRFATGITVVTGVLPDGTKAGLTVTAFCSLSLEPPMVLVCLDRATDCLAAFERGKHFAVNVLAEDQDDVSKLFAGIVDPFTTAKVRSRDGLDGVPLLEGCLATLECRRGAVMEGGDHLILTGVVERAETAPERRPLVYYRGAYGDFRERAG